MPKNYLLFSVNRNNIIEVNNNLHNIKTCHYVLR